MIRKRKILIILSAFAVLTLVLTTPLSDWHFGGSYKNMPAPTEVINIKEMNSFLGLWSELMHKDIGGYRSQQLSLSNQSTQNGFPPQLVRWLNRQGWSAERFFYDEQKLRELVNVARLEKTIAANENLLKQNTVNDTLKTSLREIVGKHKKQLSAIKVNPQELALVKENLYQITQILDGTAVLDN